MQTSVLPNTSQTTKYVDLYSNRTHEHGSSVVPAVEGEATQDANFCYSRRLPTRRMPILVAEGVR